MVSRRTGNKGFNISKPLVTIFLFSLLLTGCATFTDPETTQEYNKSSIAVLRPDQTVGQSFVSRRSRLNGLELWLQTDSPGQLMTLELYHNVGDKTAIFSENFRTANGKIRIEIPPQEDPPNQPYYVRLVSNHGEVSLLGRDEDNYPRGSAAVNDQFIDADLAFRATYEYDVSSVFEDIKAILSRFYLIVPLGIVLILPGWLLLDSTNLKDLFDRGERIAISLGLSLSIIPLVMLWTSVMGLSWGPISVWLVSSVLVGVTVWRYIFTKREIWKWRDGKQKLLNTVSNITKSKIFATQINNDSSKSNPNTPLTNIDSNYIILLAIFAFTFYTRIAMVRDLAAPAWVDSVHHALITRLMIESNGLPENYGPYLPTEADYYHFGFHASMSTFTWLTGLKLEDGLLIFGQVLNAMIVFSVYLFVKTHTNKHLAALTGALIVGVLTIMPAYYASWGRYTQLTGLLVLPVGFRIFVTLSSEGVQTTPQKKALYAIGSIIFAGLFLIHYRVAAFLGLLIFAYLIFQINPGSWYKLIQQLVLLGGFSAILLLPWFPGLLTKLLLPKGEDWSGGTASFSQIPWNFLKPGLGVSVLILAGIGLVLGIIFRKRFIVTIVSWTGLMYLLANLGVFGLPGSWFVNPISMEITLFMPIAVLGGFAISATLDFLDRYIPIRWQSVSRILFITFGAIIAFLGAQRLLPILNPITFLAREADFPAISWIDRNIPEGEIILINPTGWGIGLYVGQDGGYWISPLTGRQTMPPAVLYGLTNRTEIEGFNQIFEAVLSIGNDTAALWELLKSENIRYIYIGGRGGIISPRALSESDLFVVKYQMDGTWLFETRENSP